MNKNLKLILLILNFGMLILAYQWFSEKKETEPLIVILGQCATLLVLLLEKNISKIRTKKIRNDSEVDIDVVSGDDVKTSEVDKSKVTIKTKH